MNNSIQKAFHGAGKGIMIRTNAFDYINIMEKAADASWLRNEAIANNIANVDTPNYKRQDVDFESVLAKELGNNVLVDTDTKVSRANLSHLRVGTYTDASSFSYRLDGNNVDVETENVYLAQNQLKYEGLIKSITQEFQNLQTAMRK